MAHHPFSPSRLAMRELCPASFRMEEGVEDVQSEYAAEGTMLHEVMAETLLGRPRHHHPSSEQEELYDFCMSQVQEHLGNEFHVEKRLHLDGITRPAITFGTADLILNLGDKKGMLVDWKFGRSEVEEAADNLQMAAYAVMAADAYEFDEVEAVVVQPRLRRITRHTFREFDAIRAHIEGVIERAKAPDAPANPSEKACKYCRGFQRCPAVQRHALEAVEETRMDISMVTRQQLSEMAEKLCLAVKFLHEVVKPEIRRSISIGDAVPGWELRPGAKRKDADASDLFGLVRDVLDPAEFTACCKVSIPKIKDAWIRNVTKHDAAMSKKDAGEAFAKVTAPAVTPSQTEPKLVRCGEVEAE